MNQLDKIRSALGICRLRSEQFIECLPFFVNDTTTGSETELQATVVGDRFHVDLPITIERSNYFANIVRRIDSGDTSQRSMNELERFLSNNSDGVWENSWVRFPKSRLNNLALGILQKDLLKSKDSPGSRDRSDAGRFSIVESGQDFIRIPISYLLKLAPGRCPGIKLQNSSACSKRRYEGYGAFYQ